MTKSNGSGSTVVPPFALLCVLSLILQQASAARILAVAFVSSKSHKITYEPLLYELAARGHDVTILAPYISGQPRNNVREILTIDVEDSFAKMPDFFQMKAKGEELDFGEMAKFFGESCAATYDLPQVKALEKEKFDLIITQPIFNECSTGWLRQFNASVVLVTPGQAPSFLTGHFGNTSPPSFIPNFLSSSVSDKMTFYERLLNFGSHIMLHAIFDLKFKPVMDAISRDKMNDQTIPSADEYFKNASLILSNSHFSLNSPKPFLPDIVEVGGMHCRPARPLTRELDFYLNSSGPDGFIYFSFGSALKGSAMPEETRQIFVRTFAKLKQKVLWKWETEHMEDLPKNVKLGKWLPQQDILGHPKIRAFITHGGFGGTTESVYHGVPLLGIPMFGDQIMNMKKAEAQGYAVLLDYNDLTEESLLESINKVLTETKYREKVQSISKIFRDQPDKPLDRAVFWTEYVIRHKGAVHLRSAARELNFIQYHSIDVVATLAAVIFTVLYVIFALGRFLVRKICGFGSGSKGHRVDQRHEKNGEVKKKN